MGSKHDRPYPNGNMTELASRAGNVSNGQATPAHGGSRGSAATPPAAKEAFLPSRPPPYGPPPSPDAALSRKVGPPTRAPRVNIHLLQFAMRIRVAAPATRIALGEPHRRPVRGSAHRSVALLQIYESLREFQWMTVGRLPVVAQATDHPADKAAAQIREGARLRKHQQARIARNKVQPLNLLRRLPADEPVARTALQRTCLPACQGNPKRPQHRNIS